MRSLITVIKCKFLGIHTVSNMKGYGYRCQCCGKTKLKIKDLSKR